MSLKTYLICRIIFTFLFLITSTTIWFSKRNNIYHEVKSSLVCNEIVFSNIDKTSINNTYNIKIKNKNNIKEDLKVYIIPSLFDNNISNNYIKYQINDNEIKTLNMDGMILVSSIDSLDTVDYNLKIWVSDTYMGNLTYSGRVIVI